MRRSSAEVPLPGDLMKRLRVQLAKVFSSRGQSGLLERRDPASMRRPEVESDRVLMPATLKWLELLPEYARPTLDRPVPCESPMVQIQPVGRSVIVGLLDDCIAG